jgi:hypothetical protein
MDPELESLLPWLAETKAEIKLAEQRLKNLQTRILAIAKEKNLTGEIEFDYAGRYFRASLNMDRTRHRLPNQKEIIEQIRKMLPEGKQTVQDAQAVYDSLKEEDTMNDSVTLKEVVPSQPKEEKTVIEGE